jgi:hypothetical protein
MVDAELGLEEARLLSHLAMVALDFAGTEYHGIRCSPMCVFLKIEARLLCPYFP